ncbi:hypothetical protein [Haladaptatus sp. DYF46]|uniref:hypothetical protein n=1 Tax=Haladaptatus sp. DYF46 TaxID=2886041 RepID=UPI001E3D6FA1|nr:hypothetical protein [Haladaptatus sp. DYF46]
MTPVDIAVTAGTATISGCAIAGLGYLRSLSHDASSALRILTGEENVEDDRGLVGRVREHDHRLDDVEQRSERNTQVLKQVAE